MATVRCYTMLSTIFKCQDVQIYNKCIRGFFFLGGGCGGGRRLSRVQVNSEQGVNLESLAEAVERLCSPHIGRELVPPLRHQNREELGLGCVTFASS